MGSIKLANDSIYTIKDGASIRAIVILMESTNEIEGIINDFTDANLSIVQFINNDQVTGIYQNMHLMNATISYEEGLSITMHLTELDEVAQRLDELDAAIIELAEIVAGGE